MKPIHALAGALLCACLSIAGPAQAQSALEYAAQGMGAARKTQGSLCRALREKCAARPARTGANFTRVGAPAIVAAAERYIGAHNPMRFRGPGCKAFVNMVARRAGFAVNASMRAFDVRGMGQRVAWPQPGDYRVSARRGGGHIELVAQVEGDRLVTINGNKGGNRVGWSHRTIAGAAYYRPLRSSSI